MKPFYPEFCYFRIKKIANIEMLIICDIQNCTMKGLTITSHTSQRILLVLLIGLREEKNALFYIVIAKKNRGK